MCAMPRANPPPSASPTFGADAIARSPLFVDKPPNSYGPAAALRHLPDYAYGRETEPPCRATHDVQLVKVAVSAGKVPPDWRGSSGRVSVMVSPAGTGSQ